MTNKQAFELGWLAAEMCESYSPHDPESPPPDVETAWRKLQRDRRKQRAKAKERNGQLATD